MTIESSRPNILVGMYFIVNFIYVLYYGLGVLPQSLYYVALIAFCMVGIVLVLRNNDWLFSFDTLKSSQIAKPVCIYLLCFLIISWCYQLVHLDFEVYTLRYLIQILLPMMCAVCIIEYDSENIDTYVYIILFRCIVVFFIKFGDYFTLANLTSISLSNTDSSLMESSYAHSFLFLTIFFLYRKKRVLAIISSMLCLASFKRFCFVYLIISWICFNRLPKKEVNKIIATGLTVFFIAVPFLLSWLYSDVGAQWFEQSFHIELNDFTSSRYALAVMVRDHFQGEFNGFGTIKNYFATHGSYWAMIKAIHCDFLELYWECTIVGVAVYVYNLMKWAKRDYRILFVILYLFIEIAVGFMMNAYVEWVLCYFLIYLIQDEKNSVEIKCQATPYS